MLLLVLVVMLVLVVFKGVPNDIATAGGAASASLHLNERSKL